MQSRSASLCAVVVLAAAAAAAADQFSLLTGVDARHYPGPERMLMGPGGVPGPVYDGDRLAGTADTGPVVPYQGLAGTSPRNDPNYLGSLSMLYRRGTIPFAGGVPILGIEFLGGPLLDLDGDASNASRSLVPVLLSQNPDVYAAPVDLPGTSSYIDLHVDLPAGVITLADLDVSGTNEGAPFFGPDICTILVTIAGTPPSYTGDKPATAPINAGIDTRQGILTHFPGASGTLAGVHRITDLGFEIWEDGIDPASSTASQLGTMQFLGTLDGWLVQRDALTGQFPTLAGAGLGSTRWPDVDLAHVGATFNTANGLAGGSATIASGAGGDQYGGADDGGRPLVDFGGDLGAYLDAVVVPLVPATADSFVYLESAGVGINNSGDPVYTDTIGYDVVLIAAGSFGCGGFVTGDTNCNGEIGFTDINPFVAALSGGEAVWRQATQSPSCTYVCANDINGDGEVGFKDINPFVALLSGR